MNYKYYSIKTFLVHLLFINLYKPRGWGYCNILFLYLVLTEAIQYRTNNENDIR
jgi:hypothetical protein